MKPISYKHETRDMERIYTWEGPTGSSLVSELYSGTHGFYSKFNDMYTSYV